jgi:hypothetical protein
MSKLTTSACLSMIVYGFLLISVPAPAQADDKNEDGCNGQATKVNLMSLAPREPISGTTTLCISHSGVEVKTKVMGLIQGNAYTTWFVYIDKPWMCEHPGVCDRVS